MSHPFIGTLVAQPTTRPLCIMNQDTGLSGCRWLSTKTRGQRHPPEEADLACGQ